MNFKALTFAAVAAVGALTATAPAMAQDWYGGGYGGPHFPGGQYGWRPQPAAYFNGGGLRDREDRLQVWIDGARDSGRLPGWRAWHAQGELNAIRRAERGLLDRQGGLGGDQVAWLNARLDHLAGYIRTGADDGDYGGWRRW